MRSILAARPETSNELRVTLGHLDQALGRSRFAIRNARSEDTAWEILTLHGQLRRRRVELVARLREWTHEANSSE